MAGLQDIGNYYGAGATGINWCENQYDLILKPQIHRRANFNY